MVTLCLFGHNRLPNSPFVKLIPVIMDLVFKNVLVLVNVFSLPTACPFLDHGRDSDSDSGGFKRKATEWLRKTLWTDTTPIFI
jgi:hypothetical protein